MRWALQLQFPELQVVSQLLQPRFSLFTYLALSCLCHVSTFTEVVAVCPSIVKNKLIWADQLSSVWENFQCQTLTYLSNMSVRSLIAAGLIKICICCQTCLSCESEQVVSDFKLEKMCFVFLLLLACSEFLYFLLWCCASAWVYPLLVNSLLSRNL